MRHHVDLVHGLRQVAQIVPRDSQIRLRRENCGYSVVECGGDWWFMGTRYISNSSNPYMLPPVCCSCLSSQCSEWTINLSRTYGNLTQSKTFRVMLCDECRRKVNFRRRLTAALVFVALFAMLVLLHPILALFFASVEAMWIYSRGFFQPARHIRGRFLFKNPIYQQLFDRANQGAQPRSNAVELF